MVEDRRREREEGYSRREEKGKRGGVEERRREREEGYSRREEI